jgi:hypothetical protein
MVAEKRRGLSQIPGDRLEPAPEKMNFARLGRAIMGMTEISREGQHEEKLFLPML